MQLSRHLHLRQGLDYGCPCGPMISALAKGTVKVEQVVNENQGEENSGKYNEEHKNDAAFTFEINGGVIEVKDNKIMVLAE